MEKVIFEVRDAVHCHFGEGGADGMPKVIRLRLFRDEAHAV